MKQFTWDDARRVIAEVAPDAEPIITSITFHYEETNIRDGFGIVRQRQLEPTGATIEIRI